MFVQSHKLLSGTLTKFGYSNCVSVIQRIALRSNASDNGDQFAVLAPLARWRHSGPSPPRRRLRRRCSAPSSSLCPQRPPPPAPSPKAQSNAAPTRSTRCRAPADHIHHFQSSTLTRLPISPKSAYHRRPLPPYRVPPHVAAPPTEPAAFALTTPPPRPRRSCACAAAPPRTPTWAV
mgnify:CR=1 FL=1